LTLDAKKDRTPSRLVVLAVELPVDVVVGLVGDATVISEGETAADCGLAI
jgi:hypothetical protein